jgi:membrane associated rhomboid family serine protease
MPHQIEIVRGAFVLAVPVAHARRAADELREYARENRARRPDAPLPPIPAGAWPSALAFAVLLIAAHVLERQGAFGLDWWSNGISDSGRILSGEWWRAATALTLHTDLPHLASNVVFGMAFGVLFAQLVGSGVAWSAAFTAGFLGNLVNAWLHGVGHRSVGASTMVFGALGCLIAYEWRRRTRLAMRLSRRLAPPLLGLVMLGLYGVGDARTDVGAHVWGMLSGGVLGGLIGASLAMRRGSLPWPTSVQVLAALGTLLALAGAWTLALT